MGLNMRSGSSGRAVLISAVAATRIRGFTLLAVLFWVAAMGVGLAAIGQVWQTAVKREKEVQLLFVGDQYRRAIESYARVSPKAGKVYPARLNDLLLDPRFPHTVRHLRQLYPDPLTQSTNWGVVRDENGIKGIFSTVTQEPMKKQGFPTAYTAFESAMDFRDWRFLASQDNSGTGQATAEKTIAGVKSAPSKVLPLANPTLVD